VEQAQTAIGTSIAAEDFGARFFVDGAHPTAAVYSEQELTQEQAQSIKDSFLAAIRGTREPAVFGSGLKIEKLSVDPKDSQFIDLLRFEVEQACRFWGVPPSMVYAAISGQNVTYANVTQADFSFMKHSVDNWLVDIEDAWSALIPAPQVVKFNTSAFLRMDELGRWEIHNIRLNNKTTTVNAVKVLEDEEPFPDPEYDQPGIPGMNPSVTAPTPPPDKSGVPSP
jgi:HK97 family phage portal protein